MLNAISFRPVQTSFRGMEISNLNAASSDKPDAKKAANDYVEIATKCIKGEKTPADVMQCQSDNNFEEIMADPELTKDYKAALQSELEGVDPEILANDRNFFSNKEAE